MRALWREARKNYTRRGALLLLLRRWRWRGRDELLADLRRMTAGNTFT